MNARTLKSILVTLAVTILTLSRTAHAEEMVIEHPGDHPRYAVEIEPHLDFTFFDIGGSSSGLGLGARFGIPIVENGFVSTINNSVAISFGIDWLHYGGCYHGGRYGFRYGDCVDQNIAWLPVTMQWNFYLSTHWSVFAEPGIAIWHHSFEDRCLDAIGNPYDCGSRNGADFAFFLGGRYHFSEHMALTMRLGSPSWSVGLSFL